MTSRSVEKSPIPQSSDASSASDSSNSHLEEIEELRKRIRNTLKKWPAYDTDFSLQRWLRYYHNDLDIIVPKLEWALNTIGYVGGFNHHYETPEDIRDAISSEIPTARYFPGGLMGYDKHGNVISVQPVGRARPKSLIGTGRVSDFYRLSILESEAAMTLLRKEEAKRGCKLSVVLIYDVAEYCTSMVFMSSIKIYLNTMDYLQVNFSRNLYPDSISRIYVINAPAAINFIYQMAKLILSKKTLKKVQFLDQDWKEVFKRELGEEFVLPFWGGTKVADCPTGAVRMGGDVPDDIREKVLKSLKHLPEEKLTVVRVSARDEVTVPAYIKEPQSKLMWYFKVECGDVDFFITFNNKAVWPRFRISTEYVPEYGEIMCEKPGTYLLHFDNNHSTFTGKNVSYNVEIEHSDYGDKNDYKISDELD